MLTLSKVMQDLGPFHWLILDAFIDPVVVAIGLWMGWNADQPAKIMLAGFAAGLAGVAITFIVRQLGLSWFEGGYMFGGAHAFFRMVAGIVWAALGFYGRRILKR